MFRLNLVSDVYAVQEIYTSLAYQMVQSLMSTKILIAIRSEEGMEVDESALYGDYINLLVDAESTLLQRYKNATAHLTRE